MTLKRGIIYAVILSCLVAAFCILRRHDTKVDQAISSTVLGPKEQEKIVIDERKRTISTVTKTGPVKRQYLPPHVVSVTVGTDGAVHVAVRKYGTELAPFVGFAFSDKARVAVGADLLFWNRWETGPFVAPSLSGPFTVRVGIRVAYNVYSNTDLFVGVDNTKSPVGGITWRF